MTPQPQNSHHCVHTCTHVRALTCPDRPPPEPRFPGLDPEPPHCLLPPPPPHPLPLPSAPLKGCPELCPKRPHVWGAGSTRPSAQHSLTLAPPVGHYCPVRTATALPCPEGTLNPQEGTLSPRACQPCPAGKYCPGEGSGQPEGRYQRPAGLCPIWCMGPQGCPQRPQHSPSLASPPWYGLLPLLP